METISQDILTKSILSKTGFARKFLFFPYEKIWRILIFVQTRFIFLLERITQVEDSIIDSNQSVFTDTKKTTYIIVKSDNTLLEYFFKAVIF